MLKEHKKLAPKKVTPGGTVPAQGKKTAAERPAAPKASTGKTYTVKSGDTLTLIAKKLGIKDWRNGLYLPNKGVIGSDPNKIIAGQVLRIP
jgi:nucleoid-associated protein YgaU